MSGGTEPQAPRGTGRKAPSAFRTISEVADDLHIPQHVLRFWETKFPQLKPLKRGGGRRYYRPEDVELLRRISDLLYIQGYTIKGVQRLLREGVEEPAPAEDQPEPSEAPERPQLALPGMPPGSGGAEPSRGGKPVVRVRAERSVAAAEPGARPERREAELRAVLAEVLAELREIRALMDGPGGRG